MAEITTANHLKDEAIYLPNEIVDGAVDETPPIERIRQTKSLEAMRLFVLIYDHQNLASDFGIHWSVASFEHKGRLLKKHGHLSIWGFGVTKFYQLKLDSPLRHDFGKLGAPTNKKYKEAFKILMSLSLLETVRYIVDEVSEEGEAISPAAAPKSGLDVERDISDRAQNYLLKIADKLDPEFKWELEQFDFVFPVPSNYRNPVAVDIFRTRYRAKTERSAAFYAKLCELNEESQFAFSENESRVIEEASKETALATKLSPRPRKIKWSETHLYDTK